MGVEDVMQAAFYWLEDHFEAMSASCQNPVSRQGYRFLNTLCAALGDALGAWGQEAASRTLPE
jgi:hypothetical protein